MVEHICIKCGKIFDRKSTYNYHINRKNPCIPSNPLQKRVEQLEIQVEQLKQIVQDLQKKEE